MARGIQTEIPDFNTSWDGYEGGPVETFVRNNLKTSFRDALFEPANNNRMCFFATEEDKNNYLQTGDQTLILKSFNIAVAGKTYLVKLTNIRNSNNLSVTTNETTTVIGATYKCQEKDFSATEWTDTGVGAQVRVFVDSGATGTFDEVTSASKNILDGDTFEFDVRQYLVSGRNQVRLQFIAQNDEATVGTLTYTISLSEMYIDALNLDWYTAFVQGSSYRLGGFKIVGSIAKTLKVRITDVDGREYFTGEKYVGTSSYTTSPLYFLQSDSQDSMFPGTTGVYKVEAWLEAGTLKSNVLTYSIMCITKADENNAKLIVVNEVAETAYNYDTNTLFKYAIYNNGLSSGTPHILLVGRNEASSATTLYDEDFEGINCGVPNEYRKNIEWNLSGVSGSLSLFFTASYGGHNEVNSIVLDNTGAYEAELASIQFYLNAANRSNAQANREQVLNDANGEYLNATWTRMAWIDGIDGWTKDDTGRSCLRIPAGSKVSIPFAVFGSGDNTAFDVAFKCVNVADYEENIITVASDPDTDGFHGIRIKPTNVTVHSNNDNAASDNDILQGTNFADEEVCHLFVSISRNYGGHDGKNLVSGFINGVVNFHFDYTTGTAWAHNSPIIIGSNTADVFIYAIHAYSIGHGVEAAEKNFVNSLESRTERIEMYEKMAKLLDGSRNIDFNAVKNAKLNFFTIEMLNGDTIPSQANGWSKDQVGHCNYEMHFGEHPEWDHAILDSSITGQGTTSMDYDDWNLRLRIDKDNGKDASGNDIKTRDVAYFNAPSIDSAGNRFYSMQAPANSKTVRFDGTNHPAVKRITAKINWASSMQSHKIGATGAFNALHNEVFNGALLNEAQTLAQSGSTPLPSVAVYQYPAFGFSKKLIPGTTDSYTYEFIGLFTIGPDKGDKPTFGYDVKSFENSLMTLEGTDHTPVMATFHQKWDTAWGVQYSGSAESLGITDDKGNFEKAWEVSNAGAYDTKNNPTEIMSMLTSEWKPAYDIAYNNNTQIFEIALNDAVYGASNAAGVLAKINADIDNFRKTRYDSRHVYGDMQFYIAGENVLYDYYPAQKKYVAGVDLVEEIGDFTIDLSTVKDIQIITSMNFTRSDALLPSDSSLTTFSSYGGYWSIYEDIAGINNVYIETTKLLYCCLLRDGSIRPGSTINYATGTTRFRIEANTPTTIEIPSDAKYIYLYSGANGGTSSSDISIYKKYYVDSFNARVKAFRRNRFKTQAPTWWDVQDALFNLCFLEIFGASDNFAKNSYPYKMKLQSAGGRWKWRNDDLDTLGPIDNQGKQTKPYYILYDDTTDTTAYFNGSTSYFWNTLRESFETEYYAMGKEILEAMMRLGTGGGASGSFNLILNFIKKYFWDKAQNYFFKSAYNVDDVNKYIQAWLSGKTFTVRPLTQALGDNYRAEYQWFVRRIIFMMARFKVGAFSQYTDTSLGSLAFRASVGDMTMKPAVALYPSIIFGANSSFRFADDRVMPGDSVTFNLTTSEDTMAYIPAVNWYTSLGDWKDFTVLGTNEKTVSITGKRLREFKIGDTNPALATSNIQSISFTNTPSLEVLQCSNITGLQGDVDLRSCTRLREAYFGGTSLSSVLVPDGSKIETLVLPETTNALLFKNLKFIEDITLPSNLSNITRLQVESCNDLLNGFTLLKGVYDSALSEGKIEDDNYRLYIRVTWDGVKEIDELNSVNIANMLGEIADHPTKFYGISPTGELTNDRPLIEGTVKFNGAIYTDSIDKIINAGDASYTDPETGLTTVVSSKFGTLSVIYDGNRLGIRFIDPEVGRVCIANFDVNGDGVVTDNEASSVTSIGKAVFSNNTLIEEFPELVRFVSLTGLAAGTLNTAMSAGTPVNTYGAFGGDTNLRRVVLPSSVTTIGALAFADCSNLESIGGVERDGKLYLDNITSVGNGAFMNTPKFNKHIVMNNLTSLIANRYGNVGSFYRSSIVGFTSESIKTIPNGARTNNGYYSGHAFAECSDLKVIDVPNVTTIEANSLEGRTSLESIGSLDKCTSVGASAFADCTNLAIDVNLPSLTSLGNGAFMKSGIIKISNLGSITTIAGSSTSSSTFLNCRQLVEVMIPSSVTSIGAGAFAGCSSVVKFDMNHAACTIGDSSFQGMTTPYELLNTENVRTISPGAFTKASNSGPFGGPIGDVYFDSLTSVDTGNGNYRGAFGRCQQMTAFIAPSLNRVAGTGGYGNGRGLFEACTALKEVLFGPNVTAMASCAFYSCTALETFIIQALTPPTATTPFRSCNMSKLKIYVPDPVIEDYQAASGWSEYASNIVGLSTLPVDIATKYQDYL